MSDKWHATCGTCVTGSNVAALSPDGAAKWYRMMTSDPGAALALERRINHFFLSSITPFAAAG